MESSTSNTIDNNKRWQNDWDTKACKKCVTQFSHFTRRHHCRCCGQIYCYNCVNNYIILKPNQICITIPYHYNNMWNKQRVCDECYTTINNINHSNELYNTVSTNNDNRVIVDSMEYRQGQPFRLFAITVPQRLGPNRRIRMPIDNNNMVSVQIPESVRTNQTIHVRVPDTIGSNTPTASVIGQSRYPQTYGSITVLQVISPEEAALADEDVPPGSYFNDNNINDDDGEDVDDPFEGFLECSQCTYHNKLTRSRCKMCGAQLPT